jgi:hypothetical protein
MTDKRIIYVCGVDWQHELGETTCVTYASLHSLEKESACTQTCGAVRCEVRLLDWEIPQKLCETDTDFNLREHLNKMIEKTRKRLTQLEAELSQLNEAHDGHQ